MATHEEFMVAAAVRQIARWAIANVITVVPPEWEDYPEIGEHDWERVEAEIDRVVTMLAGQEEKFKAAYEFLSGRADGGAA